MQPIDPAIGDWCRVEIVHRVGGKLTGVNVVSGIIVKEDTHAYMFAAWAQYQLDNGMWFSPQSDKILEHKPSNANHGLRTR